VIATADKRSYATLLRCDLPITPYADALALQRMLQRARRAGLIADTLLFLEHPPTYTRGRRSRPEELPAGAAHYRSLGIEVCETDRGGRVTYHGPGQLIGYVIARVEDVVAHVRMLERALIEALYEIGVQGRSRVAEGPDFTGVWVQERKIASIGVHVAGGVTTHGFALNVDNDLAPFSWVVPCGLPGVQMTSVAAELQLGADAGDLGARLRGAIHRTLSGALQERALRGSAA